MWCLGTALMPCLFKYGRLVISRFFEEVKSEKQEGYGCFYPRHRENGDL